MTTTPMNLVVTVHLDEEYQRALTDIEEIGTGGKHTDVLSRLPSEINFDVAVFLHILTRDAIGAAIIVSLLPVMAIAGVLEKRKELLIALRAVRETLLGLLQKGE